jgi:glycosyltransferase involved in cell wall biosynthesis
MKKLKHHFLSLIIPVYKQEQTIVADIARIKGVLDEIRYHHEIIAVIDGVLDKSRDKLQKAKMQNVRVVTLQKNYGKAYAIRTGMHRARGDYVMFIDAGMEIDPNGISMLLEHMEWYGADIIVGSKRHPASKVKYSPIRKVLSYGYYLFVLLLFGVKVHDTQAGIKIFRKEVLGAILPRLVEKKFAGDLEMLVAAKSQGFGRIYEAPIKLDYTFSKVTSAATWSSVYNIFVDTLAIWYRTNIVGQYKKPIRHVGPRAE